MTVTNKTHLTAQPGETIDWNYTVPAHQGAKMQLLTIGNIAVHGTWKGKLGEFYKAWAPMPRRNKMLEKQLFGE